MGNCRFQNRHLYSVSAKHRMISNGNLILVLDPLQITYPFASGSPKSLNSSTSWFTVKHAARRRPELWFPGDLFASQAWVLSAGLGLEAFALLLLSRLSQAPAGRQLSSPNTSARPSSPPDNWGSDREHAAAPWVARGHDVPELRLPLWREVLSNEWKIFSMSN